MLIKKPINRLCRFFHRILHQIARFGRFLMLRRRFFSKCSVPCLKLNLIGFFFFNRMVSNTQKNSQLFWNKFFSQGFICRQDNATAVLDGFLDFDSFLSTAALLTQLIFSVEVEVSPIRIVNEVRSKVRFAPSCFFAITVVP